MRADKRTGTPATASSEASRVRDGGERRYSACAGVVADSENAVCEGQALSGRVFMKGGGFARRVGDAGDRVAGVQEDLGSSERR